MWPKEGRLKFGLPAVFFLSSCLSNISGCSHAPPALSTEEFRALDGQTRAKFISYYPFLKPEQRAFILQHPEELTQMIKTWKLENAPIQRTEPSMITALEIVPERNGGFAPPVVSGTMIPLRAYLNYKDGARTEVTRDVQWKVLPDIAYIVKTDKATKLRYSCADAEAALTADFLNEKDSTVSFHIKKNIQLLDLTVDESTDGVEDSEYLRLKLVAHCDDATWANVACQAHWKVDPSVGEIAACGVLHIIAKDVRQDGKVMISVDYGGHNVSKTLYFSPRNY